MNNGAMDIGAHVFVLIYISLGNIPSGGIAGPHGSSVFKSEEPPDCFPKCLYPLHAHQQCVRAPTSPHPQRLLLLSAFWNRTILRCEAVPTYGFDLHFPDA